MALKKLSTQKGFEADYWTVTGWNPNKATQQIIVDLRLYKDRNSKEQSLENNIDAIQVTVPGYNLRLEEIYPLIKDAHTPFDTYEEVEGGDEDDRIRIPYFSDAQNDV